VKAGGLTVGPRSPRWALGSQDGSVGGKGEDQFKMDMPEI